MLLLIDYIPMGHFRYETKRNNSATSVQTVATTIKHCCYVCGFLLLLLFIAAMVEVWICNLKVLLLQLLIQKLMHYVVAVVVSDAGASFFLSTFACQSKHVQHFVDVAMLLLLHLIGMLRTFTDFCSVWFSSILPSFRSTSSILLRTFSMNLLWSPEMRCFRTNMLLLMLLMTDAGWLCW